MFSNIYKNRRVLLTGHTGFKGSWLALWLNDLGAKVTGYALPPPTEPNHFTLLGLNMTSIIGDVRDGERLKSVLIEKNPEIVFHLAAQPIVRLSYQDPVGTMATNIMGTSHVLEACRGQDNLQAVIIVTSDKCYENKEVLRGCRESDPLGGYDPYSASKGCAEIVTACFRDSFFNLETYGVTHQTLVASARSGNVIGGGDWAPDRLIPDMMRAQAKGEKTIIRNPGATRPWQHVLESLSGYLLLGQMLLEGRKEFAEPWNFGPRDGANIAVREIMNMAGQRWKNLGYEMKSNLHEPHEAEFLRLDSSKARNKMKWSPVWDVEEALGRTISWYKAYYEQGEILSHKDIDDYAADAAKNNVIWAGA